jgi:hypothetical protein
MGLNGVNWMQLTQDRPRWWAFVNTMMYPTDIKVAHKSFESVTKFKYLGTTKTIQNDAHDEVRRRLNSGNACYFSVQNILPVVLYGCETWSLTQREEHRLQVFENRVFRIIFGPRREDDGAWRKLHNDVLLSMYCQGD